MQEVEDFIARIYPLTEEREFVQRHAGYCLLGSHREKIFCICTDDRSGFNGKTKFADLLYAALGKDYTKDAGNNAILYQSDFQESANNHSAGVMAYQWKRLVVIEETNKQRRINNAFLKKIHGGDSNFSGRGLQENEKQFVWSCKMIINCNDGQMADFDWHDAAFCQRMVVIRHRSKFCADEAEYERHKHEEFTYMAQDCSDKIKGIWRPYMLLWMLEGLKRYHVLKFTNKPASFSEFKDKLLNQQDSVTPWVKEVTEKTDDKMRFITQRSLYDLYKQSHPEEKSRKTAIGIKIFGKKVNEALGMEPIEEFDFKYDGKSVCRRNCYKGFGVKTWSNDD